MSGLELLILGTGGYSIAGLLWPHLHTKEIEREISKHTQPFTYVEILQSTKEYSPPTYIELGKSSVSMPLGGGSYQREKSLLTFIHKHDTGSGQYSVESLDATERAYINTPLQLETFLHTYKVDQQIAPFSLPLIINKREYGRAFMHNPSGLICKNRKILLEEIRFRKRLPLSLTMGGLAASCMIGAWALWFVTDFSAHLYFRPEDSHYDYACRRPFFYPPFWMGKKYDK